MDSVNIDYDAVVRVYRERLTTDLRGFRGGPEFLSDWVASEDEFESVAGMCNSARAAGLVSLTISFGPDTAKKISNSLALLPGRKSNYHGSDGNLVVVIEFENDVKSVDLAKKTARIKGVVERVRRAREDRQGRLGVVSTKTKIGISIDEDSLRHPGEDSWKALAQAEKLERLTQALREVSSELGLRPEDLRLLRLEKENDCAIVELSKSVSSERQGPLMMKLERLLQNRLSPAVYLYQDEMRDLHKLRRKNQERKE